LGGFFLKKVLNLFFVFQKQYVEITFVYIY